MVGYWTRMAKTGNPNGGGAPEWPVASADGNTYLEISKTTGAKSGPASAHCDLWDKTPMLWPHI
jgi:para-nitrobenzyl esterase